MKVRKYVVQWTNLSDDDSSCVMGLSEEFGTREDAQHWLDESVAENESHDDRGLEKRTLGDVLETVGRKGTCYYHIAEFERDDPAVDCVETVRAVLMTDVAEGEKTDPLDRIKLSLAYIDDHQREWLPVREWVVGINIRGIILRRRVMAATEKDAVDGVNEAIANGRLVLTDLEKRQFVNAALSSDMVSACLIGEARP